MLLDFDRDELTEKCDSLFEAIITTAKRARDLNDKEADLLDDYSGNKDVSKAMEEMLNNKIEPDYKE